MKRFMPKDRGKSFSIFKRLCHITIEVEEGAPKQTKKQRHAANLREDRLKRAASKKTASSKKTEKTEKADTAAESK
jgi:hypothetical protein